MDSGLEPTAQFILASASPRRRQLLEEAGYRFEVVPSHVNEEDHLDGEIDPEKIAETLANQKAQEVAGRTNGRAVVLGADTIVAIGNEILGKGRDEIEAKQMLFRLSRTRHRVITGIALIETQTGRTHNAHETSWVTMNPMSESQIDAYIASGAWIDKAGSYAVQEGADKFISRIDGSYTNVVGLPMELTTRLLKEFGITPTGNGANCP